MNGLQLYHQMPASLRSAVASVRGYQLRLWRYGKETDRKVCEALARELWSKSQWDKWRQERLGLILHRAVTKVPYYREYWAARRRRGDKCEWENIANWPILEKETLRLQPRAFLAEDVNPRFMFYEHTSGTTGKPLDLWFSRESVRAWYALVEARWRRWNGVDRHSNWAILGGQLIVPVTQRKPPFWVWNRGLRQLYLSSYHLAPDLIGYYVKALWLYKPAYIVGYSSSLYSLATEILRAGYELPPLRLAITNAEPIHDYQRYAITEAFHCPVRETYGMCENVANASECGEGVLHLWPEAGILEVVNGGRPAGPGQSGEFICTGLLNPDMPLVRYRVGDRGSVPEQEVFCRCGRSLPWLGRVDGRNDDVLYTPSGKVIGRLDPVFKASLPIREAQIVQTRLDQFTVRYVPAGTFTELHKKLLVSRLKERLGEVQVTLESLAEIPRTSNGKFRAVMCNLPALEIENLKSRLDSAGTNRKA
jgi:phenylacetate-CoA ligase